MGWWIIVLKEQTASGLSWRRRSASDKKIVRLSPFKGTGPSPRHYSAAADASSPSSACAGAAAASSACAGAVGAAAASSASGSTAGGASAATLCCFPFLLPLRAGACTAIVASQAWRRGERMGGADARTGLGKADRNSIRGQPRRSLLCWLVPTHLSLFRKAGDLRLQLHVAVIV